MDVDLGVHSDPSLCIVGVSLMSKRTIEESLVRGIGHAVKDIVGPMCHVDVKHQEPVAAAIIGVGIAALAVDHEDLTIGKLFEWMHGHISNDPDWKKKMGDKNDEMKATAEGH